MRFELTWSLRIPHPQCGRAPITGYNHHLVGVGNHESPVVLLRTLAKCTTPRIVGMAGLEPAMTFVPPCSQNTYATNYTTSRYRAPPRFEASSLLFFT